MINNRLTKDISKLPDFIICGAMKAGTTSLNYILNFHESIFILPREIFFFDIDDIQQHPDFFVQVPGNGWTFHDYERDFDEYVGRYRSLFEDARDGQLIGEDSTTYLASKKAPVRIAELLPNVKLIFLLRDPVTRAYSHYWHDVRTGRAIYNFEKTIQYMQGVVLQRGCYKRQIERYRKYFPADNIKIIIFEEFINNIQAQVDDVCEFIGLDDAVDITQINTHRNIATFPRFRRLQLLHNKIFRRLASQQYLNRQPGMAFKGHGKLLGAMDKVVKRVNLTRNSRYPAMTSETREFLQKFFARENRGISDLIGKDIRQYWDYMPEW